MKFAEVVAQDRRLVMLRLLEESAGYTANESLIALGLEGFGHRVSRDQVRTDFQWLKENGLVDLQEIASVMVASLTQRGLETASGIVSTPGVKRPSPNED